MIFLYYFNINYIYKKMGGCGLCESSSKANKNKLVKLIQVDESLYINGKSNCQI